MASAGRRVGRVPAQEQGPALKRDARNLPQAVTVGRGLGHRDRRGDPRTTVRAGGVWRPA